MMHLSGAGLELLKLSEGFRSRTYLDVAGNPTIGFGHRLVHPEYFADGISEAQGEAMLQNDVRAAERAVERLVHVPLSQGQLDALVDFVFNLGEGQLAASTLLKDLNDGQYHAAGGQLLRWDHAGGEEVASLKARRESEFRLWSSGGPEQQAAA